MKITAFEIKEHRLRKNLFGYNTHDVESLKEIAASAIEYTNRKSNLLEEKLKMTMDKLSSHEKRESVLKDTITTAQKMVEDLKNTAFREAELIIAEARQQADEITRQARDRILGLQDEIFQLKKQRIEFETSIKAIIEYHSNVLLLEEEEAKKADEDVAKLKFFHKTKPTSANKGG